MADNSMSLLPGSNPTGGPRYGGEGFVPGAGTSSGSNPMLLPPNLPASAPQANPFGTSVVPSAPVFGANASGGYSTTNLAASGGTNSTGNPVSGTSSITGRQQGRTLGELQSMYGEGLGALMYQFLQSGAGFNQDAINNLFAALQPGIERGTESLMEQFSATGNRFGSGAEIGLGDFLSQVNLNEGQLETQMYEQSIQNYMNVLSGVSKENLQYKETTPSTLDNVLSGLGLASSGAAGVSGIVSALDPNADTGLLDAIGSLSF